MCRARASTADYNGIGSATCATLRRKTPGRSTKRSRPTSPDIRVSTISFTTAPFCGSSLNHLDIQMSPGCGYNIKSTPADKLHRPAIYRNSACLRLEKYPQPVQGLQTTVQENPLRLVQEPALMRRHLLQHVQSDDHVGSDEYCLRQN